MATLVKGSNFTSAQDVKSEFGTTTLQNLSNSNSLASMYQKIFGALPTAGDRLSDFDGYGSPLCTTGSASQDCSSGQFKPTFNGDIDDMGGLDCGWDFEYDTDPLFPSPSYTAGGTEPGSPPNGSASVSDSPSSFDFSDGQTVYYRLRVWNAFNDDVSENDYTLGAVESHTFSTNQLSTPSWTNSTVLEDDVRCYLSFEYADDETGFDFRYRVNGGTTQTGALLECENANVGTGSNPKEQVWDLDQLLGLTDTLEVQIKAKGDACNDDSPWSAWETASGGDANRCPL